MVPSGTRGIDVQEPDGVADWEAALPSSEALTLTGMETMQEAFRWWREEAGQRIHREAQELAVLLVQCRFLALIRAGINVLPLTPNVPIAVATHDSDIVVRFDPPHRL